MMSRALRHWGLTLLLLLCVAIITLCYSTWADRMLVKHGLAELTPMQVEQVQGSLATGLELEGLSYQTNELQVKVHQLVVALDWRCLGQLELCIDQLTLHQVQLQLFPGTTSDSAPQVSTPPELPTLRIRQFQLTDLLIQQDQTQLTLQQFSSSLVLAGQQIIVGDSRAQQLRLERPRQPANPNQTTSPWWFYQPLDLQQLRLPLRFTLQQLTLDQLQLSGATDLQLSNLITELQAGPEGLAIKQFSAQLADSHVNVQGQWLNTPPYAVSARIDWRQPSQQLQLDLAGTLQQLQLKATGQGQQQFELQGELAPLQADLPIKLELEASHLQWPLTGAALYQLNDTHLQIKGSLPKLSIALNSQSQSPELDKAAVQLQARFAAPRLQWQQLKVDSAQGQLTSQGEMDLNLRQLTAKASLQQFELGRWLTSYPGQLNADLDFTAKATADRWQLQISQWQASGNIRQLPLQSEGQLEIAGVGTDIQQFQSSGFHLQHGNNLLHGQGQLTKDWQLQLQLQAPDLASSLEGTKGAITGQIDISGRKSTPKIQFDLNASQLKYQQQFRLTKGQLRGLVDTGQGLHQLNLETTYGMVMGQRFTDLSAQINGDRNQSEVQLQLNANDLKAHLKLQALAQKNQQ